MQIVELILLAASLVVACAILWELRAMRRQMTAHRKDSGDDIYQVQMLAERALEMHFGKRGRPHGRYSRT